MTEQEIASLRETYRRGLLDDVVPFWMRHGLDREHGGFLTALNEDGRVVDTDKAVWMQGRGAWLFATLHHSVERRSEWLEASRRGIDFLRECCRGVDGKLYFTVTREGKPLRMRRYVYSEAFAAMACAAYARASGDARAADEAIGYFDVYLRHSFDPGVMPPKTSPSTRPMKGLAPLMITIVTAQELRTMLGDPIVHGARCSEWIDRAIAEIARDFYKPEIRALLETVGPRGEMIEHFDGRLLNPGHALECAWFILHEARLRGNDAALLRLGLGIIDCMWERGWDREFGGLLYFTDLHGLPVQEYWHEMKFWWPHNEAVIATLLAWRMTGSPLYAARHREVHTWAHRHFPDPVHGEWFGYLRRDGRVSTRLKGSMWKGPFHLPRMQWYCWKLL